MINYRLGLLGKSVKIYGNRHSIFQLTSLERSEIVPHLHPSSSNILTNLISKSYLYSLSMIQ